MKVALVSTGLATFPRLGVELTATDAAGEVRAADAVVLPGVGALGPAMARLEARGAAGDSLAAALRARVGAGRATLAICLGLQILCRGSEEAPGVPALGAADVDVARLADAPRLPHFGWNAVAPEAASELVRPGAAYFAHSYAAATAPAGFDAAWTVFGGARFVAAFERGPVLACQFHPELSGSYGADLLARWLARAAGGARC